MRLLTLYFIIVLSEKMPTVSIGVQSLVLNTMSKVKKFLRYYVSIISNYLPYEIRITHRILSLDFKEEIKSWKHKNYICRICKGDVSSVI